MSAGILEQLQALPKLDQRDFLAEYIKGEFKQALYFDPQDNIATDVSIFDLGLNSLAAETLKQRFEQALECNIDTTDFFANPTVGYFIENLSRRLFENDIVVDAPDQGTEMRKMINNMLHTMYGSGQASEG